MMNKTLILVMLLSICPALHGAAGKAEDAVWQRYESKTKKKKNKSIAQKEAARAADIQESWSHIPSVRVAREAEDTAWARYVKNFPEAAEKERADQDALIAQQIVQATLHGVESDSDEGLTWADLKRIHAQKEAEEAQRIAEQERFLVDREQEELRLQREAKRAEYAGASAADMKAVCDAWQAQDEGAHGSESGSEVSDVDERTVELVAIFLYSNLGPLVEALKGGQLGAGSGPKKVREILLEVKRRQKMEGVPADRQLK